MPNWVHNSLLFVKPEEVGFVDWDEVARGLHPDPPPLPVTEAERVVAALSPKVDDDGEVLSFERLLPTPPELLEGDGWYEWRVESWGTKWDARNSKVFSGREIDEEFFSDWGDDVLAYRFDTAWSPPDKWFVRLVERFPDLLIYLAYAEETSNFAGLLFHESGRVLESDLSLSGDKERDESSGEILERFGLFL